MRPDRPGEERRQRPVDTLLRDALGPLPEPRVKADFVNRLCRRIEAETGSELEAQRLRRSVPTRRLARQALLHAYWMAAILASVFIGAQVEWPPAVTPFMWTAVAVLAGTCLVPLLLIRRFSRLPDMLLRLVG